MLTRALATAALALAASFAIPAHAHFPHFCGGKAPHPIDVQLDRAIDASDGTTFDIREAQSATYEAWDQELNRTYKALLAALAPDVAAPLREAQRAWLAWDKAEGLWTEEPVVYGGRHGGAPGGWRRRGVAAQVTGV